MSSKTHVWKGRYFPLTVNMVLKPTSPPHICLHNHSTVCLSTLKIGLIKKRRHKLHFNSSGSHVSCTHQRCSCCYVTFEPVPTCVCNVWHVTMAMLETLWLNICKQSLIKKRSPVEVAGAVGESGAGAGKETGNRNL